MSRVVVNTVTKAQSKPKTDEATALATIPPVVALPDIPPHEPPRKHLSTKTVKRILEKAIEDNALDDMWDAELLSWAVLADGTTVGVVEDTETAVHYHWTVCPKSFEPLNLGPIDD